MDTSLQKILILLFVLLVVTFVGLVLWLILRAPVRNSTRWTQPLRDRFFPSHEYHRQILQKRFAYYRQLSLPHQLRFEKRVRLFLAGKTFTARGGLTITEEVKVLVAACAVQLTFGLPPISLRHFRNIIVYPDAYYSTINQDYHQGEVNAAGAIVLSWKHFLEGYLVPNDARNVGLHEMAHALLLENRTQYDGEYDFLDQASLDNFLACAEQEYHRMQKGESELLRKYAQTSPAEFFSVAVEVFFENSQEMQQEAPLLYKALKELLKQDPVQKNRMQVHAQPY